MAQEGSSWSEVWPLLEGLGWRSEQGPRGTAFQTYYLPPGVQRSSGFKNRVDYFDSKKLVLRHAAAKGICPAPAGQTAPRAASQKHTDSSLDLGAARRSLHIQSRAQTAARTDSAVLLDLTEDSMRGRPTPSSSSTSGAPVIQAATQKEQTAIVPQAAGTSALQSRRAADAARAEKRLRATDMLAADSTQADNADSSSRGQLTIAASTAKVTSWKALVELYGPSTPEDEVLATLQRLDALGSLSFDTLKSTLIGKSVNSLMKRVSSVRIRTAARQLLSRWKGSVSSRPQHASGSQTPAPVGRPTVPLHGPARGPQQLTLVPSGFARRASLSSKIAVAKDFSRGATHGSKQVATVPPGVDSQVWMQIPAACQEWAVSALPSTPTPARSRADLPSKRSASPNASSCKEPKKQRLNVTGNCETMRGPSPPDASPNRLSSRVGDRNRLQSQVAHNSCVICLSNARTHAFVPCGHECVCRQCSDKLVRTTRGNCPICRTEVTMAIKIFR